MGTSTTSSWVSQHPVHACSKEIRTRKHECYIFSEGSSIQCHRKDTKSNLSAGGGGQQLHKFLNLNYLFSMLTELFANNYNKESVSTMY